MDRTQNKPSESISLRHRRKATPGEKVAPYAALGMAAFVGYSLFSGVSSTGRKLYERAEALLKGPLVVNSGELKRHLVGAEYLQSLNGLNLEGRNWKAVEETHAPENTPLRIIGAKIIKPELSSMIKTQGASIEQPLEEARFEAIDEIKKASATFNGYGTKNNDWEVSPAKQAVIVTCGLKDGEGSASECKLMLDPRSADFKKLEAFIKNQQESGITTFSCDLEGVATTTQRYQERLSKDLDTYYTGPIVHQSLDGNPIPDNGNPQGVFYIEKIVERNRS